MKKFTGYKQAHPDNLTHISSGAERRKARKFVDYDKLKSADVNVVEEDAFGSKEAVASIANLTEENLHIRKENVKKTIRENKKSQLAELHSVGLTEIYYRALPLDEDYKTANSKDIKLAAIEFFSTLMENDVIDFSQCDNKIVNLIEEQSNIVLSEMKDESVKNMISSLVDESKEVIHIIETKVNSAVTQEYNFNAKRDEFLQENLEHMSNEDSRQFKTYVKLKKNISLIESLNRINIKKEIVDNGSTKIDGDKIFGESIQYYTMLETVHTLKLINTDIETLNENLNNMDIEHDGINILEEKANMDVWYGRMRTDSIGRPGLRNLESIFAKEKKLIKTEKDRNNILDDLDRIYAALEFSITGEAIENIDHELKTYSAISLGTTAIHLFDHDSSSASKAADVTITAKRQKKRLVERREIAKKGMKVVTKMKKEVEKMKLVEVVKEKANMDVFFKRSQYYKDNGIDEYGITALKDSFTDEKKLIKTEKDRKNVINDIDRLYKGLSDSGLEDALGKWKFRAKVAKTSDQKEQAKAILAVLPKMAKNVRLAKSFIVKIRKEISKMELNK